MKYLGIASKLTLILILFAMVIMAGLGIQSYTNGRDALKAAIVSELLTNALEKQAALENWITDRRHGLEDIANQPALQERIAAILEAEPGSLDDESKHAELVAYLENWAGEKHRYLSLDVIDASNGQVIASTDETEEGKFREAQPYFINALKAGYVQNPYYDIVRHRPIMTAAVPIHSPSGKVEAVLAGLLNMDELNAIILRRSGLHQTDDAFLVNTSNLFVTQPRLNPDPAVLQRGIHTEAVKRCLEQTSGTTSAVDYRDVPAFIVYRWLPDRQLCLIVKLDQSEAFLPVVVLRNKILLYSTLALLAAGILAWVMARSITRPVQQLAKSAALISAGNLDTRIKILSKDEIGQLAGEFNHMAGSLEEMRLQLNQRAEQLEAANKELEAFSYSISHDLRAPLRAMDGFSRILLEEHASQLPGEAQRYLKLVRDNAQQMGHLIEDLLVFSRLSRLPINKQKVNPELIVRQVIEELRIEQGEQNVKISIGNLPTCQADPALLKQVWVNLLTNAIKFSRQRKPAQIEIGWIAPILKEPLDDAPDYKPTVGYYYVKDNGVGFDMQYVTKLFGVFQRLHRAEEFEGTGVGLAIVQRIVHRHGGRVWADAKVDKGAIFCFTLEGGT